MRRALCLTLAALLSACTPKLLEKARPVEAYQPVDSKGISVESAALTSTGLLALCVAVRDGGAEPAHYTVEADQPSPRRAQGLVAEASGRTVLIERSFHVVPGCDGVTGSPVPVVHPASLERFELPPNAGEVIYSYEGESGWSLGYYSTQPLLDDHYSVDFDLSHTGLFAYVSHKPQLLLVLLPVAVGTDAALVGLAVAFVAATTVFPPGFSLQLLNRPPAPPTYAPLDSAQVVVESATVTDAGVLFVCVEDRARVARPERFTVEIARTTPERAKLLLRRPSTMVGNVLIESEMSVHEGCDAKGTALPVVHVVDTKALELPPGAHEAIYSALADAGWSLGYLREQPLVLLVTRVSFDLSHAWVFQQ